VILIEPLQHQQNTSVSNPASSVGIKAFCSEVHKLINSILNKEELPEEWKELIIVINYKKCDKTIIIYA
jgi:hypothetical protein